MRLPNPFSIEMPDVEGWQKLRDELVEAGIMKKIEVPTYNDRGDTQWSISRIKEIYDF